VATPPVSGFLIHLALEGQTSFWQVGYGLFSVSPSHVPGLCEYILNQEERHKKETFRDEYLRLLKKSGATYDERYLWD